MAFALIFIVVLSIILLAGAFLIWKSDLPEQDKIVSIIAILALFSLVSIVNEAKKSSYEESKYNVAEFEKYFYTPPDLDLSFEYRLPILSDYKEIISQTMEGWDPEKQDAYQFAMIYGEGRIGKSLSFQEYSKILQNKRIPTLYIDIKRPGTDVFQFAGLLKLANLHVLDDVIERFNNNGRTPNIVVDNIQNAFIREGEGAVCSVCEYLKGLFDSKKLNIILISSDVRARENLQSSNFENFNLKADMAFNKRMNFFEFKERGVNELQKYLLEKVNYGIRKDEKKFNDANISQFLNKIGWSFQVLHEYISHIDNYDNVEDFINKHIEKESQKLAQQANYADIMRCVLSATGDSGNNWVEYGSIKKNCGTGNAEKLDEAVSNHILIKKNNLYKFRNNLDYFAASLQESFIQLNYNRNTRI